MNTQPQEHKTGDKIQKQVKLIESILNTMVSLIKKHRMYPEDHQTIHETVNRLYKLIKTVHEKSGLIVIGILDGELIYEDALLKNLNPGVYKTLEPLKTYGIDTISFQQEITPQELSRLTRIFSRIDEFAGKDNNTSQTLEDMGVKHISLGKMTAVTDKKDSSEPEPSQKVYQSTLTTLFSIFENIRVKDGIHFAKGNRATEAIVNILQEQHDVFKVVESLRHVSNDLFNHTINVCILNVLQGIALGFEKKLLQRLAFAGMTHDVGKQVIAKMEGLSEKESILLHPVEGAKVLLKMPDVDPVLPIVAFEHHQNYDLSGYPKPREKKQLNPFSLITSLSDTYDLNRTKTHPETPLDNTMSEMKKEAGSTFDPFLFSYFERLFSV